MSNRIYIGNLPADIRRDELDRLFDKYGPIRARDIKYPAPGTRSGAYAFLEFDDPRDAQDAVRGRDGIEFAGGRIRVESARGGHVSASSRGPPRRSAYRARITGLPSTCSWQDLKDHMRQAGDVGYSNVERTRDGNVGIVEYGNADDLERAIRKLDRSEFVGRHGDRAEIRVSEDRESRANDDRRPDDDYRREDRREDRRDDREDRRDDREDRRDDRREERDDRERERDYDRRPDDRERARDDEPREARGGAGDGAAGEAPYRE